MALEGTLKDFGLADILQLIGIQRKTGTLTVENDEDAVTVTFLEGQVVGADTRRRNLEDLLGSVLVRTGRITAAQLQESLKIQKSTLQRLGYILVKAGFVSEQDLQDALRIQVTQIVYRLFRWRAGRYHFAPAEHVEYDREHFAPIGAETILMEGARMVDEWPIIEKRIRSGQMVLRKTVTGAAVEAPVQSLVDADIDLGLQGAGEAGTAAPEIQITPEAREVLRMVDGRANVQEISERCPLGEFDTYRLLYELVNRSLIEEIRAASVIEPLRPADLRERLTTQGVPLLLATLAVVSLLTLRFNPAAPWRMELSGDATERLRTFASRARLERVEQAVRAFYLDFGAVPPRLDALVHSGYLKPRDLLDPWSRPYVYRLAPEGYRIEGHGGADSDELTVQHRFTAAERMVLEGAAGATPIGSRGRP
ncbi:MAG: DUF4388 domain-containing protein [Acidobacteriia bacterium]|nr:DUF4388 domain-containing protein [Terriglobia bacterium]